ncbi:mucin-17 [Chelonus insularis]|uniref:mucin-17 n=1 Tax=Chelonus insularis TaxID=460826 RepID=UPI00158B34A6|nr:mucin-17 [Chelonus insularis]
MVTKEQVSQSGITGVNQNGRDDLTVLLVSARPGKSIPPVGLIGKTARTFVQDGASTEYATQVLGTTLDNGRVYAQILSTSSRVFYEKDSTLPESSRVDPFVVYPSRVAPQDEWKLFGGIIEDDSAGKREEAIIHEEIYSSSSSSSSSSSEPHDRENDIFEVRKEFNVDTHPRFKPAKVRTPNLPTYTVKQELVGGFAGSDDANEEDGHKSFKPRVPKIFKHSSAKVNLNKKESTPLQTVTYHGFADFTTTVGDTVIIFSPSTSSASPSRPATTIKGDATLRPGDGNAVLIKPTSIVKDEKTVDPMLEAINGHSRPESSVLSSSMVDESGDSSSKSTPLLLLPENETAQPTGLLKVIDSTTSADGTTTHYKSLIYGTYVGTNYAQIIHTSSNVYFFPDEASVSYDTTTTKFEEETEDSLTTLGVDSTTSSDLDETLSPEVNELTTLLDEVTENVPTTIKISNTTPMEPEILNDIVDPQGRSVKGGSAKNNIDNEEKKIEFATRLLPSTAYKTFTYFTTFFIPDPTHKDVTTTSVRSREVVSSEVSYLTELILPSATETGSMNTALPPSISSVPPTSSTPPADSKLEDEESTTKKEEIELIFKTLYTTYTYLTTFFQESTSSVSSREVVETNVVTQTIGPDGISGDFIGLFNDEVSITPTKIVDSIQPSIFVTPEDDAVTYEVPTTIEDSITESGLTTLMDLENEKIMEENKNKAAAQLEPSPVPNLATEVPKYETKTYFTTYTYFTTIFVDDETEIETRTEVFSNIVTEKIEPTAVVPSPEQTTVVATTPKSDAAAAPPEILAYLEALKKQKSQEEALEAAKKIQESSNTREMKAKVEDKTEKPLESNSVATTTEKVPIDGEVLGSMITDVISSSSSFDGPILEPPMDKRNVGSTIPEDQELSESNHHEVEPAPTLLLRTSFTTFTYFTTMYKGDASDVTSRLETVTNIVTETIRPTPTVEISATETSSLPVTYFTTFTYWTTFYRAGDTITTSREETVSNVVTPGISATPTAQLGVIMTYRPDEVVDEVAANTDKTIADNEVMEQEKGTTPIPASKEVIYAVPDDQASIDTSTINPEPTTYYTTFTYFTTSYIGNETILNSRLETITSVDLGSIPKATGRAIGGPVSKVQDLEREEKVKPLEVTPTKTSEEPKTGLLSTIRSSDVTNGTTTHYSTDIYGTYIDGLYAQVVQSTTSLETPSNTPAVSPTSVATPPLPTGVLSLNKGSIIDADKVTTVYFATSQIGTLIDGLYAKVIESTSSTKIDAERKATLKQPEERHRTGLVRLIKGQIEVDGSTVIYQSKVIGTSIEGRYAQIIESTSSYIVPSATVSPTGKVSLHATLAPGLPSPTPAVIQSSISDGNHDDISNEDENEEDEEESEDGDELDENGQKEKKKSRLTFSSRKRTFTPAIRPFLSRSRPTFNPKRKGAQGATTITRTDITPTITATLAGSKGNRFASSRGRPVSSVSPTASINSSRRFSGRRNPSSSIPVTASSVRGRTSGRISASPTYSVARRGPSSIRGSSARPAIRGSSSIYPGASSRFRGVIRPSSTLIKSLQTANPSQIVKSDDQEDEANEFTATTLVTEETPFPTNFDDFEETATTIPVKTTTESSRRSTNPLLRFRRPVNLTPASRGTPLPRRTTTTTTKAPVSSRNSNARSLNSPTLPPFAPRSRTSNRLFPPRNFINQRQPDPVEGAENVDETETNIEDDKLVEEIIDNDYEGSENNKRRRVPSRTEVTSTTPRAYSNRFYAQRRRSKRQAPAVRPYQPNRYRRPLSKSAEDRSDVDVSSSNDEESTTKTSNRYSNVRGRSLSTSRPPAKSSLEKYQSDSGEISNPRTRRPTAPKVKPTPTTPSSGRQFTLREKNLTYKRTSSKQDTTRRPSSRVRTSGRRTTESSYDARRGTTSRSSTRSRTNNRRVSQRGRGGSREDLSGYWKEDGTITVTHYIPTEVTIPVVSNGATEYKNIITPSPSVEVLGPEKYNTVTGGDGRPLVIIASESSGVNHLGQTEVTRFLLHSTPTSRVSHTLTTIGGRRVSQSLIVPSTVYSVENVVSTVPPSINNQNSPLANILLSQLLLGQLGQPNNVPAADATPTTQYKTRTTTYVTTITKEKSTVIPLTFRGKEILTTLVDSSTNVVTATEFITDTVVVTPTATLPTANLNSLLLLLQQTPQAPQQPVQDPLFAAAPIFSQSNSLPGETERKSQPVDLDYRSEDESSASAEEFDKPVKSKDKLRKKEAIAESSVVTIFVSGKRPGEFSTILSTVKVGEESTASRRRRDLVEEVRPSIPPSLYGQPEATSGLSPSEEFTSVHAPTQSLESVVGDVGRHISTSIRSIFDERNKVRIVFSDDTYGDIFYGQKYPQRVRSEDYFDEQPEDYVQDKRRKVIRVRVPSYVSRENAERQHKYTVVRKRPLVHYTKSINPEEVIPASSTPRRIVITRVRNLGARSRQFFDEDLSYPAQRTYSRKHKVTVTRTRKLRPTLNAEITKTPRTRVTRKKLVTVRPVITSTPTYAIITTGFYGIPNDEDEEVDEDEEKIEENTEDIKSEIEESERILPSIVGSVNNIEDRPDIDEVEEDGDLDPAKLDLDISEELTTTSTPVPIIITDNFFFPASSEDDDSETDDDDDDQNSEMENEEVTVKEEIISTTEENENIEDEGDEEKIEVTTEKEDFSDNVTENQEINTTESSPVTEESPPEDITVTESSPLESTTVEEVEQITIKEVLPKSVEEKIPEEPVVIKKEFTTEKILESTTPKTETSSEAAVDDVKIPEVTKATIESSSESTTPTSTTTNEVILEPSSSTTPEEIDKTSLILPKDPEEQLSVVPLDAEFISSSNLPSKEQSIATIDIIPSVIPLESSMSVIEDHQSTFQSTETLKTESSRTTTTLVASPTPEEIEAGLSDELYLSLSRPDFPVISSSKIKDDKDSDDSSNLDPHSTPTIIYTETTVTSTRLRTYTYVVTKLNGLETQVTSSTTVRPRVTTLTLTVPVTIVPSSIDKVESMHLSTISTASGRELDAEGEGRRLKLATRIMSNGVEVIVAGPTPALRWENSNPQPTLTLSDAVVMLMPQEDPNEFVTKTCTTTFTYLNTITKDGTTIVSTDQQVIANTATEERHRKPGSESAAVTLAASPTLRTEVFKTTYTYLTLNTDHPDADNALSSSQKVITNTVTAPQHYLDMILEPSEAPPPQTNTYLSTRVLEKTFVEDGVTKIETRSDMITRLIITESVPPPPRPTSVTTTLTALDDPEDTLTDILKTHYITYTYYNTYLEKGSSTVVRTNVATSTDVTVEKAPKKTAVIDTQVTATPSPEPIKIFATKTYLTTFTYFTTLLQAGPDGETSTTISSRSTVVKSVVTESIAPSLLNAGYMNLLTTSHHSDSVKNVVTGSTIIYFDEDDQIDSSSTSTQIQPTVSLDSSETAIEHSEITSTNPSNMEEAQKDEPENDVAETNDGSDGSVGGGLLNLGSLGINSLSALGPVITAMAGLLQGKPSTNRRNDTITTPSSPPVVHREPAEVTTPRSPIYIPVSEFIDGDIETAESQNIAAHLVNPNPNFIPETRHKVAASIVDGIPISPGEVITANSDVIIGKPGILAPRPPQTYLQNGNNQNFGMKPPPVSVPNIPVHPVLEVLKDEELTEPTRQAQHVLYSHPKRPPKIPGLFSKEPIKPPLKHDLIDDPLLKPPNRPNIDKYANPNINPKEPEWIIDRLKRPWNSHKGLVPPPVPPTPSRVDDGSNMYGQGPKPWQNRPIEDSYRPTWAQNDQIITAVNLEGSEVKPELTEAPEPIIHQVPHVIDRSTGQPLLVNIQPSQVANVVIPQGGTQALIFGDTSEPHITGQYFDDPSPYPEHDRNPGQINFNRPDNNPANFIVPPAPPSVNYNKPPQKSYPHTIPISNTRVHQQFPPSHDKIEIPANRLDKRPSEILLIQRPESHKQSSQGQVHTEILVHYSPDTENVHGNVRPQSNPHQASFPPPRRDYYKPTPNEQLPPRRTADISSPTDTSSHHRYNYHHEKPNRTLTNDILKQKWKNDRTKQRITVIRPRPPLRRPVHYSHPDRAPGYGTRSKYPPYRPMSSHIPQASHPQQIPINWQDDTKVDKPPNNPNNFPESQDSLENVPTGAIGYRNPLIGNAKRPMSSIPMQPTNYQPSQNSPPQNHQVYQLPPDVSPPIVHSLGEILPRPDEPDIPWSETQTEAGLDSTAEESEESIKYHEHAPQHHNEYETYMIGHQHDPEGVVIGDEVEEEEVQSQKNDNTEQPQNTEFSSTVITPVTEEPVSQENQTEKLLENHNNYPSMNIESPSVIYEDNVEVESQEHKEFNKEKPEYEVTEDESFGTKIQKTEERPNEHDEMNSNSPEIISQFVPEKPFEVKPVQEMMQTPPSSPEQHQEQQNYGESHLNLSPPGGHARPHSNTWGVPEKADNENKYYSNKRNLTIIQPTYSHGNSNFNYVNTEIIRTETTTPAAGTRVHPAYPHILTKPRPVVPGPITISTGSSKVRLSAKNKTNNEVSLQPERTRITMRPIIIHTKDKNKETLETAFQTNFATHEDEENVSNVNRKPIKPEAGSRVPSRDMMPPPPTMTVLRDRISNNDGEADLKPPPIPADVVGMSPPPVDITTTTRRPIVNTVNELGLRPPPPNYIPLDTSTVVGETPPPPRPPPPSLPKPSKPFLVELLSQDMVPPRPPVIESSRPIEIATGRPAIAVSGSIQIATAVATSHIPVMQDIVESTIPIIHGTVDLPVMMDVSEIIRSSETRKPEHVSVYTVRPFETRPVLRVSVQPTTIVSTSLIMPTRVKFTHIYSTSTQTRTPVRTKVTSQETVKKPSVILEASRQSIPVTKLNSTQSLNYKPHTIKQSINPTDVQLTTTTRRKYGSSTTKVQSSIIKTMKEVTVKPTTHEKIRNVTSSITPLEIKPKAVTHFKTLTVTRTETSVVGSPPTTRTLLLTHTLTSTIVETVTETLLRPTNVIITSVTTILQPATRLPTYENSPDNMDSIFVVMSDQNPPAVGAEEVEAEYGTDEEVSRDEQDPAGNEIHRVLSGSILGASIVPHWSTTPQCQPECKSVKAEVCAQVGGEARCICQPGFARMFPDRPCKPTYTYTVRVGLDRIGRESIRYSQGMNNATSPVFKKLSGPIKEALDRTLMQSDLRDIYRDLNIVKFHPNPMQVEFHVQFTDNTNETKLKEVLQKYVISSNYSLGGTEVYASNDLDTIDARDFDECSTEEGGPYHDCSPYATCFNLHGSYQCSCQEGWADLSENSAYPGRICSQAPLGCTSCNNKGHCVVNSHGQEVCECFPWHSGQRCQVNLKVLLIALVTTGAILLGLLGVCLALACHRHPGKKGKSSDRRAMIATGTGGDTSSEGSAADLAIPHHVPHVLPPPPRSAAPLPPGTKRPRKATKQYRTSKKPYAGPSGKLSLTDPERSLSVMIPRAKYRSGPHSPQNYSKPPMSTFAAEEHKLINYLEGGQANNNSNRKASVISTTKEYVKSYEETGIRVARNPAPNNGALVSAGFQVSATVMKTVDGDSTLDDTFEPSTLKTLRSTTDFQDGTSTLARSCDATTIQATTELLPLDLAEENSSVGRSYAGDTSIKQQTPSRGSKDTRDARDSASEGPITAERDLGSTLRLRHTPLYNPDRAASDRDSNFDSL